MSEATPLLALPLMQAAQAQKHVTHNEALTALDTLVQLAVIDKDLKAPPASPAEGARYLIASADPSGAWAGWAGRIVRYQDGRWLSFVPRPGWFAFVTDEADLYTYAAGEWRSFGTKDVLQLQPRSRDPSDGTLGQIVANSTATALKWFNGKQWLRINNFCKFAAFTNFDNYIPANVWTKVQFNNTDSNEQGAFAAAQNHFVAAEPGLHRFSVALVYKRNGSNAPAAFEVRLHKNGAAAGRGRAAATGALVDGVTTLSLDTALMLSANDTVAVFVRFTTTDGYVAAEDSCFTGEQLA